MEKWVVMAKRADFRAIADKFGIDPVIARVIRNRDIVGDEAIAEYLYGGTELLRDPLELKDMDRASVLLKKAIADKKRIRVIGDYDIDGIMASYILKTGIRAAGGEADIRIPNRMTDGYGMNEGMIDEAEEDGIDLIVTCDNGISAGEAVKKAKAYGMTVIVTDHHEVEALPEADAVVDPKREDDHSANPNLCGAAIAWKLVRAIGGDPDMKLLQFAAFATVGDIVELTGENRIIVKEGLRLLRESDNTGLRALADAQGIRLDGLSAYHIGFVLGPCLNASGRLDTAMRALALLEARDTDTARTLAEELRELNDSRKALTESGVKEAVRVIEEEGLDRDRVLVVFLPDVHESIAGIIAGRIRENYGRPAFVLTRAKDGVKGSGRSTEMYSMFEELCAVKDLLIRFGGHPMAAGLTLAEELVGEFRRRINQNCTLTEEDLMPCVRIDVPMPVSYVTEELVRQIGLLEPFGKGNPRPLFAEKNVHCENPRLLGAKQNLLKTTVQSPAASGAGGAGAGAGRPPWEGRKLEAICFRGADALYKRICENPDLAVAYEPGINEYMGQRRVQITISHFQ